MRCSGCPGGGVVVDTGAGTVPAKTWEGSLHANAAESARATVHRVAYRTTCRLVRAGERLDHRGAAGAPDLRATGMPHRRLPMDARLLGLRSRGLLLGAGRVDCAAAALVPVDARLLGLCERHLS